MKHLLKAFFLTFALLNILFVHAATFTVNTTGDLDDDNIGDGICADINGDCSLRAAMTETFFPGTHVINFAIPGPGPHTIVLTDELPAILNPTTIDATSEPGYGFGTPLIVIDGSGTPAGSNGIILNSSNCVVRGLVIGGFTENAGLGGIGVFIDGVENTLVAECFIGIAADGVTPFPNFYGVQIEGGFSPANNNQIGGTGATDRNLISGNNSAGIFIFNAFSPPGAGADNNEILGNFIGTDITGTIGVGNFCGIAMADANGTTIGGATLAARNIISSNIDKGIDLANGCNFTTIQGNFIGTDINGTNALANNWGIRVANGSNNTQIGGPFGVGSGNLISGNLSGGITISSNDCSIQGNLIGVQSDFSSPLANGPVGVFIEGGTGNLIGGLVAGLENGNIIAHHTADGVQVSGSATPGPIPTATKISRNAIFGNGGIGIDLGEGTADDGQNANDLTDVDTGPNMLQNYAIMTGVSYDDIGEMLSLTYEVPGDAVNLVFPLVLEVFVADVNGQGQFFWGSDTCTAAEFGINPQKTIALAKPAALTIAGTEDIVNTITDNNGNTSEFSVESPLPVGTLEFQAKLEKTGVLLSWQHDERDLIDKYLIERKTANRQFAVLVEIPEDKATSLMYHLDQKPIYGVNTYRLQMHHLDGQISYSNIVEVIYSPQNLLNAYFDAQNQLNANIFIHKSGAYNFKLIDVQGRMVGQWQEILAEGNNSFTRSFANLAKGTYVLISPALGQKIRLVK